MHKNIKIVDVLEWLLALTRNHVGIGSNLVVHNFFKALILLLFQMVTFSNG